MIINIDLSVIAGNKGGGNPEDSTVETLFYSRHWFGLTNVAFDHTCALNFTLIFSRIKAASRTNSLKILPHYQRYVDC